MSDWIKFTEEKLTESELYQLQVKRQQRVIQQVQRKSSQQVLNTFATEFKQTSNLVPQMKKSSNLLTGLVPLDLIKSEQVMQDGNQLQTQNKRKQVLDSDSSSDFEFKQNFKQETSPLKPELNNIFDTKGARGQGIGSSLFKNIAQKYQQTIKEARDRRSPLSIIDEEKGKGEIALKFAEATIQQLIKSRLSRETPLSIKQSHGNQALNQGQQEKSQQNETKQNEVPKPRRQITKIIQQSNDSFIIDRPPPDFRSRTQLERGKSTFSSKEDESDRNSFEPQKNFSMLQNLQTRNSHQIFNQKSLFTSEGENREQESNQDQYSNTISLTKSQEIGSEFNEVRKARKIAVDYKAIQDLVNFKRGDHHIVQIKRHDSKQSDKTKCLSKYIIRRKSIYKIEEVSKNKELEFVLADKKQDHDQDEEVVKKFLREKLQNRKIFEDNEKPKKKVLRKPKSKISTLQLESYIEQLKQQVQTNGTTEESQVIKDSPRFNNTQNQTNFEEREQPSQHKKQKRNRLIVTSNFESTIDIQVQNDKTTSLTPDDQIGRNQLNKYHTVSELVPATQQQKVKKRRLIIRQSIESTPQETVETDSVVEPQIKHKLISRLIQRQSKGKDEEQQVFSGKKEQVQLSQLPTFDFKIKRRNFQADD